MTRNFLTVLFCILMCLSCVRNGIPPLDEGGYTNLAESVVIVRRPGSICTGFFINNEDILTAAHCLSDEPGPQVYDVIGYRQYTFDDDLETSTPYRVVEADLVRDIALLEPLFEGSVDFPHNAAPLYSGRDPRVGTRTISVGHPAGQLFTVTTGIISRAAVTREVTDVTFLHSNAPIYLGNSGGPLFDEEGRVLGIANSIRNYQSFLGVYVSYGEIQQFLEEINYDEEEEDAGR